MEGVKYPVKTKQKEFKGAVVYYFKEARTEQNLKWRWWKPWVKRFLYFPEGYYLSFETCGTAELDNTPIWRSSGDFEKELKRSEPNFQNQSTRRGQSGQKKRSHSRNRQGHT